MAVSGNGVIELLNQSGEMFWDFSRSMFLQASLLVLVILLLDLFLRYHARAVTRYWLWSLVLLKLTLPVSLYSPVSVASWFADWLPTEAVVQNTESEPTMSTLAANPPGGTQTEKDPLVQPSLTEPFLQTHPQSPQLPPVGPPSDSMLAVPDSEVESPIKPAALPALQASAILMLIWLTAVAMLSVCVLWRTGRVRKLTLQAEPAGAELVSQLNECVLLLGMKPDSVKLKVSEETGSPAICGFWRATIILPRHLLDKLNPEQYRQIFIHELAHWKRFDLQVNCLQTLLLILYFYHPLVWLTHVMLKRLREQAVDETVLVTLNEQPSHYSATLLDIAALTPAVESPRLQLLGILESRKSLTQRIRRMITRPIPRSARLGLVSLLLILFAGALLLPMSRLKETHAAVDRQESADQESEQQLSDKAQSLKQSPPARETKPREEKSSSQYVLSGRVTDQSGAPVTDAQVLLIPKSGGHVLRTSTDKEGNYHFSEITKPGPHRIMILSQRWVGLERLSDRPRVDLAADQRQVKNITLERACQLRIQTIDEQGKPVPGAIVYRKLMNDSRGFTARAVTTDQSGEVTLGLKPSQEKYLIGIASPDYALEKLTLQVDDPDQIVTRKIVLREGEEVNGKIVYADGKIPVGLKINALPQWWEFSGHPHGYRISEAGRFTFPHIVAGVYNVIVAVPGVGGKPVLTGTYLLNREQPLDLKLNIPSPASMVTLSGKISYTGDLKKASRPFLLIAYSIDGYNEAYAEIQPGQTEFKFDPIQRGKYQIGMHSTEYELKGEHTVFAPADNLQLNVVVSGKPQIRGTVLADDTNQPISKFRVRAIKLKTLRGADYGQEPRWQDVDQSSGEFKVAVNGPGIYRIEVAADGYARALSESVNTDQIQGKPIQLKLTEGVTLTGTVVNAQRQPIDGATVIPLSLSRGVMSNTLDKFTTDSDAVKTVDGKFSIPHLAPGMESLKVTHPDYDFAIVKDIDLAASPLPNVEVTLTEGGTVQGLVTDENGKPQPNVTLFFQDRYAYNGDAARKAGLLATVITDEEGRYSVSHLPNQICYVVRKYEWNSLGVVRQAVLPQNGKTSTLNLGGRPELTGRLIVNGKPLANTRILLAGENPNFGIFRAYTNTDSEGMFHFFGAGPGQRTLYYEVPNVNNDWVPVRLLELISDDQDLGTLETQVGQLTVNCQPETLDDMRVGLFNYHPVWTASLRAGNLVPRTNSSAPFVFNQVTTREYVIVASRSGYPSVYQKVHVTKENLNSQLTLPIPEGTATIHFKLDQELMQANEPMRLKLWSKDQRLLTNIYSFEAGEYVARHLPAGDYYLTRVDIRESKKLLQFTLKENEQKTVTLTSELFKKSESDLGFRTINVFTQAGVPLPGCQIQLKSSSGTISRHIQQFERQSFVGDSGTYDLTVSYPGFQTLHGKVELIPPDKSWIYPDNLTFNLRLKSTGE